MKKYLYTIAALLVAVGIYASAPAAKAYLLSFFTTNQSATATTTLSFMTAGTATTTYNLGVIPGASVSDNSDVDVNYLYIQFKASTSPAVLQWNYQASNDSIDWYNYDSTVAPTTFATAATVDTASSTVFYRWNPGSTLASTSLKVVKIPDISGKYKRVLFSIPAGSVNGAVWMQDNAKRAATQ